MTNLHILVYILEKHPYLEHEDIFDLLYLGKKIYNPGTGALYSQVAEYLNVNLETHKLPSFKMVWEYEKTERFGVTQWWAKLSYLGKEFVGTAAKKKQAEQEAILLMNETYSPGDF